MDIILNPARETWNELLKRPAMDTQQLFSTVGAVLDSVRRDGDYAVRQYELQFDHARLTSLQVTPDEFRKAAEAVPAELQAAIRLAHSNISKFHEAQAFKPISVETAKGIFCTQKAVPIENVGLYIPGGTAPLFSTVLMLATPAKIAGCRNIILCSPPDASGHLNAAILYAAQVAGVDQVFKVGGAQAIAAMAYGTQSIPKVNKIFGPGNQYVVAAKQMVSLSDVAIDMPAGPSEVEVLADASSNAQFVAADLLSQAEHGVDSQVLLVSTDMDFIHRVDAEISVQLEVLPRKEITHKSLLNSKAVFVPDVNTAIDISNVYAPEHLVIAMSDYNAVAERITNAGSVFLGQYSCESAGDYASGTNHTLPTKGYAHAYSGLCLDSFSRKMTLQYLTPDGIRSIGIAVEIMAEAEGLDAHKNAMSVRINNINSKINEKT